MLVLEPYVKEGGLELISILTVALLWMVLIRIDVKRLEPFVDTIQTRPCQIYFTDKTTECDRGDFLLSDVEFDQKYPSSVIAASYGLMVHYKFENTLANELNPNANKLTPTGNIAYAAGRNGGKALWLKNEPDVDAGRRAANYIVNRTFIFPQVFTISMSLMFKKFSPNVRQNVAFVTNSGPNILTRSLVLYVYRNVLYCSFENIPGASAGSYPIEINAWYDIVITYKDKIMTLYVNGINTGTSSYLQGFTQQGFMLGNDSTTTPYPFAGLIDDFRIYNRIILMTNVAINSEIKAERLRLQGLCKQEFPGWVEPIDQPIKQPKELTGRGNLRDWAFCYKPLFNPITQPPAAIYNRDAVEANFNTIQADFNRRHTSSYSLVDIDTTYVPVPTNSNLRYNQATPEYIRMNFKSPIAMETFVGSSPAPVITRPAALYASSDVSATCDNDAVSYSSQYATLPPQYGLEISFAPKSTGDGYSIVGIKCVRTANNYQLMYEQNLSNILPFLFDIKTNLTDDTVYLQGKNGIRGTMYKFVKDICGRLTYLNMKKNITLNLSRYLSSNRQAYLYDGLSYKFGMAEPMTNKVVGSYNLTKINEQTNALTNIQPDAVMTWAQARKGFIQKFYKLSHMYDDYKIRTAADMNTISTIVSGINVADLDKFKLVAHTIYSGTSTSRVGPSDVQIKYKKNYPSALYQSFTGFLDMTPVKTNEPYEFRLFINSYDREARRMFYNTTADKRPLRFYMDLSINSTLVTSFYYCSNVDTCINEYNTNYCLERQQTLCKIPEWDDYYVAAGRQRVDAHHNPAGSALLNATNNTIQLRIFTNANLIDPTPFCRITYRAPGQSVFNVIENNRIFYSKRDYAQYLIGLNNNLITKVDGNKTVVTNKMFEYMKSDYDTPQGAAALPLDPNYISINNRAYIFFNPPASVASANALITTEETSNIAQFSANAFVPN